MDPTLNVHGPGCLPVARPVEDTLSSGPTSSFCRLVIIVPFSVFYSESAKIQIFGPILKCPISLSSSDNSCRTFSFDLTKTLSLGNSLKGSSTVSGFSLFVMKAFILFVF